MSLPMKVTLANYYIKHGVKIACPCFEAEKSIIAKMASGNISPDDEVYQYSNTKEHGKYFKLKSILSNNEVVDYLAFKQIDLLTQIKKCLLFFVSITIIGILAGLIYLLVYWRII